MPYGSNLYAQGLESYHPPHNWRKHPRTIGEVIGFVDDYGNTLYEYKKHRPLREIANRVRQNTYQHHTDHASRTKGKTQAYHQSIAHIYDPKRHKQSGSIDHGFRPIPGYYSRNNVRKELEKKQRKLSRSMPIRRSSS